MLLQWYREKKHITQEENYMVYCLCLWPKKEDTHTHTHSYRCALYIEITEQNLIRAL